MSFGTGFETLIVLCNIVFCVPGSICVLYESFLWCKSQSHVLLTFSILMKNDTHVFLLFDLFNKKSFYFVKMSLALHWF